MPDPNGEAAVPFSEIQPRRERRYKRIFNRTDAADYLGKSLTKFDEMRKESPFFDADTGDKKQGGGAFWSIQRLDLMADVVLGWLTVEEAEDYMRKYRSARYEDISDMCLSEADKYRREARLRMARKRQKTLDAKKEAVGI